MGLVYGSPVEDVVTGLTIQYRGWKPVFYNPDKRAFLGFAPSTLDLALVQFKRWSEGMFQIFLTRYCPFVYGHGNIKLAAQMGYCVYLLWAPGSFPTVCYVLVPSLCLLHGIPLFPEVSSLWFLPFAYVFCATNVYSLVESLYCGDTLKAWWNTQRMWLFRRITSFMFGFVKDMRQLRLGLSQTTFAITAKVVDDDVLKRYEQEVLEFGSSSMMFTIISTLSLVNLGSFGWGIFSRVDLVSVPQIMLCGIVVLVNLPVYQALFLRNDKGCIPSAVMLKSMIIASLACLIAVC